MGSRKPTVLLVVLTCSLVAALRTNGEAARRPMGHRDTVLVVVRDERTLQPVGCFNLEASRPRAIGGTPYRKWGGFVDDSTGTTRLGGVRGGTVQVRITRDGYVEAWKFLGIEPLASETLLVLLTRFSRDVPSCQKVRYDRLNPSICGGPVPEPADSERVIHPGPQP